MVAKRGIAMIELIFALVIIGIVLMSAPMLIHQSIKSSNIALQQEAISAAAAQTSIILSMHWDEKNSNIVAGVSPILASSRVPLDFNSTGPKGLIDVSSRNSTDGNNTLSPTVIGNFGKNKDVNETNITDYDDIDDYDGSDFGLMVFNNEDITADIGEYIDVNLQIHTEINYANDIAPDWDNNTNVTNTSSHISVIHENVTGATTNIKFIQVNLTSDSNVTELEKDITMTAFSCNIGTFSIKGKSL